jgi:hypothetical protein
MRWYRAILAICIIADSLSCAAVVDENSSISGLKSLLTTFDDPGMDTFDLAFFLVTHNYDATPRGSYVEVQLDGMVLRLTPNGEKFGLGDIV